jgi:phage terminase Nu1 subunit (DNA packaging protein)
MTDAIIVNRKALAQVLGVSVRHLANLEADGVIRATSRKRGAHGSQFDLTQAVPAYVAHVSAQAEPGDARRRKDSAAAHLMELRAAEKAGTQVSAQAVIDQGVAFAKAVQAKLRSIPSRAVNTAAIPRESAAPLKAVIHDVLREISEWKGPDVIAHLRDEWHETQQQDHPTLIAKVEAQ